MAKNKKKNMGRVKHYRHSFYSGPQRVRRAVILVLVVALLFAVGWFIGPHVIDFGTRTWYSIKRGGAADSVSSSAAQSQPESQSQPGSIPEPQPEPAAPQVEQGSWAFVSLSSIDTAQKAQDTAQKMAQQGVHYAVIPLKDEQGYIYYPSTLPTAAPSVAATTIDAAAAAQAFRQAGLEPVAQLCAFRDPKSPYTDRTMGIHYQDSEYFWLDAAQDAGGKAWMDPYSPSAQNFIQDLMNEVRGLGFEQILLSGMQFPPTTNENAGYQSADRRPGINRLAELIALWQQQAREAGTMLWLEYPLAQAADAQPAALAGGAFRELGAANLMLRLPQTEDVQARQAQLEAALASAREGGAEYLVLREGSTAQFVK